MKWSWSISNALTHVLLLHWHGNFTCTKFCFLVPFDRTNSSCSSFVSQSTETRRSTYTEESLLPFILVFFHYAFFWNASDTPMGKVIIWKRLPQLIILIYKIKLILLHIELYTSESVPKVFIFYAQDIFFSSFTPIM